MNLQLFIALLLMYPTFSVWPCRQIMNAINTLFCGLDVFERVKNMSVSLYLVQSKYIKNALIEILSIGCSEFEFFCALLYTD